MLCTGRPRYGTITVLFDPVIYIMIEKIKKLRNETGLSFSDIKHALEEANGDEKKALEILRLHGHDIVARKSLREAKEGIIGCYVHSNKKIVAVVQLYCETDFVAKNQDFQNLAHDLAMQVASMKPLYLDKDDIPQDVLENVKKQFQKEAGDKPKEVVEKIIEGKLKKYCQNVCLLDQPFIKDEDITIRELIAQHIAKLGENIRIGKFERIEIG